MTNENAVDIWTPVHVVLAGAMGVLRFPRPVAYVLIFGVEIFEFVASSFVDMFRESRRNIAADLIVGIAAYELGRMISS